MRLFPKAQPMAEIVQQQKGGRRKLPVPRIDLTPMVDLGFLLITFFMFTTTLAQQKSLELNMPSKEVTDIPTAFPEESTITVLLGSGHRVVFYKGSAPAPENMHDTSFNGLSKVIAAQKGICRALPASFSADAHELHVIIKPTNDCHYEDVVHVVDFMLIHKVEKYAIVDAVPAEAEMLAAHSHK
jgi:biopolymer transport protein ExbD